MATGHVSQPSDSYRTCVVLPCLQVEGENPLNVLPHHEVLPQAEALATLERRVLRHHTKHRDFLPLEG